MPDMAKTYNEQAENFARFAPQSFTFVHIEKPAWEKLLDVNEETRVLDIGSGSGRMAGYLTTRKIKPENITGIEISQNLVDIAKRQIKGANFICGDARERIPAPDGSFDLVISHMVMEFFDEEGLLCVLLNAHRLLKKGGTLCFITTHPDKMTKRQGITKPGWFETDAPWGGTIQNWYRTKEDFKQALQMTGFNAVMEDLHVPPEAEEADKEAYAHALALDPMRLAVKALKR